MPGTLRIPDVKTIPKLVRRNQIMNSHCLSRSRRKKHLLNKHYTKVYRVLGITNYCLKKSSLNLSQSFINNSPGPLFFMYCNCCWGYSLSDLYWFIYIAFTFLPKRRFPGPPTSAWRTSRRPPRGTPPRVSPPNSPGGRWIDNRLKFSNIYIYMNISYILILYTVYIYILYVFCCITGPFTSKKHQRSYHKSI